MSKPNETASSEEQKADKLGTFCTRIVSRPLCGCACSSAAQDPQQERRERSGFEDLEVRAAHAT
jgi:hypothetical protein